MPSRVRLATFLTCLLTAAAALLVPPALAQRMLETDGEAGRSPRTLATATRHMIAAANAYATDAGLDILRAGGSAVDAAITAQLVLNLVEPQSSGIGGGAFLLHWDERMGTLGSFDGRETAPAGLEPDAFQTTDGKPRDFWDVLRSGASVGTPGLVRMLALAHARHGRLPWRRLFEPAIALAEGGFTVSHRLHTLLDARGPDNFDATARDYFFTKDGKPRAIGSRLRNPSFAATLRRIAAEGPTAFYVGPIAESIVSSVQSAPRGPGALTAGDIAHYAARERSPVCTTYRAHRICGMGPPSSGGLAVAMSLQLVSPHALGPLPMTPRALHIIAEAQKLAYADRDRWIADPDQVAIPAGLLDPRYLASRMLLLDPARAAHKVEAGTPPGAPRRRAGIDATSEIAGTTHLSVIDSSGNAVALTSSIEAGFGSGLMASGFLLNNQLTDFSFRTHDAAGRQIANAPAPRRRPRSSMSPTIVFGPDGRLFAVLGSPGGSRIPLYVTKAIVGLIDWKLDAQAAADLANFGSRNGPFELEAGTLGPQIRDALASLGHTVAETPMTSGIHAIVRRGPGRLEGSADPRREGAARGD